MVLENRVLTKCFGISKHHTQRQADDLSRTDGDSSGKVWGTLDSDYNEGEAALLKGLLTARKDRHWTGSHRRRADKWQAMMRGVRP